MIESVIVQLIPLYILIALGYVAGRWLQVRVESIAKILIYIIAPAVFLGAMIRVDFNPAYLALPLILMMLSYMLTGIVYKLTSLMSSDGMEYLISGATVNGNAIYFGLPVMLPFFEPEIVALFLLMNLGPAINNFSLGYYLVARGRYTVRESLLKLAKMPVIYAAFLGLSLNVLGFELPAIAEKYWQNASGAMVILGMMMIGLGLSKLEALELKLSHMAAFLLMRFALWPLSVFALVMIDKNITHLFSSDIYQIAMIFSVMPIYGNLVAYAAEHNLYPERAAAAVLASTVFTLVSIPLMFWLIAFLGI